MSIKESEKKLIYLLVREIKPAFVEMAFIVEKQWTAHNFGDQQKERIFTEK